jgi:hypothetical protein
MTGRSQDVQTGLFYASNVCAVGGLLVLFVRAIDKLEVVEKKQRTVRLCVLCSVP